MAAINELDAFCIALPHNVSPFAGPDNAMFLPVVNDELVGHHTLERHFPVRPASSLISLICTERAVMTVDHSLLVNGAPMSPEKYIARWRARLASPVPLWRLALDKGLRAVAVFQWRHSPEIGARKASRVNPPYNCFGDLLADRGFLTEALPAASPELHLSTLKIDLASQEGARTAWWADEFLCSSSIQERVLCRRVEFHRVAYDAQPVSFHSSNAAPADQVALAPA